MYALQLEERSREGDMGGYRMHMGGGAREKKAVLHLAEHQGR